MAEELFEHTTGQGKEDKDSNEEMEALKFSEKMIDDKIDKDAILQAIALYHVYSSTAEDGNVVALRGLNVSIKNGEAVAIVGPSGSGKSTLLKCLGVLMKPSAGGVILNGISTTRRTGVELVKMRQDTVSFIFQEGNNSIAEFAFRQISKLTNGAYCRLDVNSAQTLRQLLRAVANYAVGGRLLLEDMAKKEGGAILQIAKQLSK